MKTLIHDDRGTPNPWVERTDKTGPPLTSTLGIPNPLPETREVSHVHRSS